MGVTFKSKRLRARKVSGSVESGGQSLVFMNEVWMRMALSPPTLTVTLEIDEGTPGFKYAPHGVSVEVHVDGYADQDMATADWDTSMHRLHYEHNWGDDGARFTVPQRLVEAHRDRSISIDKKAWHLYRESGRYNYTAFVYDRLGNWGWAQYVFEVAEDDFTDDETIVVSADRDFRNAPYTKETNRVSTIAEVVSRIPTDTSKRRVIYLKRGDRYLRDAQIPGWGPLIIRDWGSGPKPIIHLIHSESTDPDVANKSAVRNYTSTPLRIQNLKVTGVWDVVTETALPGEVIGSQKYAPIAFGIGAGQIDVVTDGCEDQHVSSGYQNAGPLSGRFFVHEHYQTDHHNFLFLGGGAEVDTAFIGCAVIQNPEASNGSMWRDVAWPDRYLRNPHNGIRMGEFRTLVVANCDLRQRQGWTLQNFILDNPILRINTNGATGCRYWVNCSNIEGAITNNHANGNYMPVTQAVINSVYSLGNPTNGTQISLQGSGATVKNCKLIRAALPSTPGVPVNSAAIIFPPNAAMPNNQPSQANWSRNEVYNNTIVNLYGDTVRAITGGKYELIDDELVWISGEDIDPWIGYNVVKIYDRTNVFTDNNVTLFPNRPGADLSDGPLDDRSVGWEGSYPGVRRGYELVRAWGPLAAEWAVGQTLVVPYPNDWYGNPTNADTFAQHWERNAIFMQTTIRSTVPDENGNYPFLAYRGSQFQGTLTFAFEEDGVHITNNTGETWPAGFAMDVYLDRGKNVMVQDKRFAMPAGVTKTYDVLEESGAYRSGNTASGLVSLCDFYLRPRVGSGHKDTAAGTPSKGAAEAIGSVGT